MKLKLTLEYAGDGFCGWQRQEKQKSVQGELERSLSLFLNSLARAEGLSPCDTPHVCGSGRTDSGVHARGQVASFLWPSQLPYDAPRVLSALNGISSPQLSVLKIEEKDDSFDARATPHDKCYSYYLLLRSSSDALWRGRAWRLKPRLRIPDMIRAASFYRGTHDFSSFRASDCSANTTVRTISLSEFTRLDADSFVFTVCGTGFLKQMIRIMLGTLVDVGLGKRTPEDIQEVIAARDRSKAGITAPAQGLVLEWVRYRE